MEPLTRRWIRETRPSPRIGGVSRAFVTATFRASLGLAFLYLVGQHDPARAEPTHLTARVVLVGDARVYLASRDSIALEPGTILTFAYRGKKIAAAEVTAVYGEELIAAKLTSGSLRKVKKLERLEVTAERPTLHAVHLLRIGYPARTRFNLLFACGEMTLHPRVLQAAYRTDLMSERSYRLVRDSTLVTQAPWPDTLVVRLFDETADEEIALERGDLDVAVFWPGEPSTHIREVTRWQGHPSGMRTRGVVAATDVGREARRGPIVFGDSQRRSFDLLNEELFRGDLAPCAGATARAARSDSVGSSSPPGMLRFEVDSSCPGRLVLERFLNREQRQAAPESPRVARVSYVDAPIHDLNDSSGVTCLFALRCPVISAPGLRPYLDALDVDAFANLFDCEPAGRRP